MSVLSLPVTGHTEVYVNGDVTIDKTAAIAPGVILQATAQGKIIIKAGACIGMGTVLTANDGTIEIGEGAVLGAGVLMIGSGKISDRACIGTASTLIATSVGEMELVSPGSLLGDPSRHPSSNAHHQSNSEVNPDHNGHGAASESNASPSPSQDKPNPSEASTEETATNMSESDNKAAADEPNASPSSHNTTIYGQTHIERLMVTLFPHKEKFKKDE